MEKYTKALLQKIFGNLSPSEVDKLSEKYLKGLSDEQAEIAREILESCGWLKKRT